jgi:peptidyl-prolyl cis-trans isomerase B (cyclophilin B)
MKRTVLVFISALLVFLLASCGSSSAKDSNFVRFEMEDGNVFYIELYPAVAPETVKNFKKLVSEGFYDGIIFHRVSAGVLIQGGDPSGTGYYGSDKKIKGEFASNGFSNELKHTVGVVSMARSRDYNSASSQFFVCVRDMPTLDGDYAAFGKVVKGMEVVSAISRVPVNGERPLIDQKIKTAALVDTIN